MFVVRWRIGLYNRCNKVYFANKDKLDWDTKEIIYYTNIKSKPLREVLRTVLQRINVISLKELKLSITCPSL